jgi:protocatechuate 3,4-dioxygenase beta subunit
MIRHGLFALALLLSFAVADFAQTAPEPAVSVELIVRGPDGKLTANKAIEIKPAVESKTPPLAQTVTTDSHGVARFNVKPGYFRLEVTVLGLGYGTTAPTEFEVGETARPSIPLLSGYGSMDGSTPSSCPPEAFIGISSPLYGLHRIRADKSGHFHVDDLPGGDWFLFAATDDRAGGPCGMQSGVHVNVGEETRGVTLHPLRAAPAPAPISKATDQAKAAPSQTSPPAATQQVKDEPSSAPSKATIPLKTLGHSVRSDTPIVWARGVVTDESGHPVQNATVYALGTYYGGIRMNEILSKATTDENGHYEIKGASGLSNFSATLVASAPGHPPAWTWPAFPQVSFYDSNPSVPEPVTQDFVLPSKSGQMSVTVFHNGQPVSGANVAVYLEGANLRDIWARGGGGGDREQVENVAHPAATTDSNGFARFEDLLPGRYTIYALADGKVADIRGLVSFPQSGNGKPSATAVGIPVRIGEETRHTLNLYEEPTGFSFSITNRDGAPLQGNVPIQLGPADRMQSISSISLDSNGQGHWNMLQSGLSEIRFVHKKDSSTGGVRSPDDFLAPYDAATALLAISPELPNPTRPPLRMRRIDQPAVDIEVRDSKGNPVRATVAILESLFIPSTRDFVKAVQTGSTDAHGKISFGGLESDKSYWAHVTGVAAAGAEPPDWEPWTGSPPPTEQAKTRLVFVDEPFTLAPESRKKIVVSPVPLGYARGVLNSKLLRANQIGVWLDKQPRGWEPKFLSSPITGEFIAGPLPAGRNMLHFRTSGPEKVFSVPTEIDPSVELQARMDIDLDKYVAETEDSAGVTGTPNASLGMGGISTQPTGAQHLIGRVLLADGITPALGAEVLYFQPGSVSPPVLAVTDALGEMHSRGLWQGQSSAATEANELESPVLVAFLPGYCGAAIYTRPIHRDVPLSLTLPKPISVAGALTVGGQNLLHRPGVVHILAEYQDKGVFNAALSVETTADAEGNFALNGLTAGHYVIQAALDDIWISPVVDLQVPTEQPKPIRLAIPAPGAPVQIEFVGHDGKPVVGLGVRLDRSGPLAQFWPQELRSDGAGSLYIPTLEAGKHTIHLDQVSKPVTFDVPSLPAAQVVLHVRTGS